MCRDETCQERQCGPHTERWGKESNGEQYKLEGSKDYGLRFDSLPKSQVKRGDDFEKKRKPKGIDTNNSLKRRINEKRLPYPLCPTSRTEAAQGQAGHERG